jgi:hypothetical protein
MSKPSLAGWQVTASRAAAAYRANRETLEPVIRLAADLLALAALARRRTAATPARPDGGGCR